MSNAGYIYVLINPSMEGLVKIGKTTRDPTGRAKELSVATGVPTSFVLAYDALFDDCSAAEEFVHALLEQKGSRVSSKREFFSASLSEAVKAVIEAERVLGSSHPVSSGMGMPLDNPLSDQTPLGEMAWKETLEGAEYSYYGLVTIEDHAEASRLYKVAARLGSSLACIMLGIMSKKGEACKKDRTIALDYFKQGLRLGDDRSWAEMAILFFDDAHYENATKCWHNYFGSNGFREDKPNDPSSLFCGNRLYYVVQCYMLLSPLAAFGGVVAIEDPRRVQSGSFPGSFKKELATIKEELLAEITASLNRNRTKTYMSTLCATYENLLEELNAQI